MTRRINALKFAAAGVLLALVGVTAWPARAQQPWESQPFLAAPTDIVQAAAQVPPEEGADVVVLYEFCSHVFDAQGRDHYTQRLVYRIETQRGAEVWDTMQVYWQPWRQERPSFRARVVTPDGVEHILDPETIGEYPARQEQPDVFSDARMLQVPLPAIQPGVVVEREIQIRDTAPFTGQADVKYFHFGQYYGPTLHTELVVEAPSSLPLHFVQRLLPTLEPERTEANAIRRLVFKVGRIATTESYDSLLPPDVPQSPYVAFSTGESWQASAAAYSRIVDSRVDIDSSKPLALEAAAGATDRETLATRLLKRVNDEVRYTGIEFNESAIVPHTPQETLQRKYGDCKDKATLLVSLLRAAGLEAYVALLNVGGSNIEPDLPGLGAFNHAIVYVPGEPALWIDPTHDFARAGELPLSDQGRLALVASPNTSSLITTPVSSSADNRVVETREFFLAEHGPARVVETSQHWGAPEIYIRVQYNRTAKEKIHEWLEKYVEDTYLAEGVDKIDFNAPRDLSEPFYLRLEATGVKRGWTEHADAGVAIFPVNLLASLPNELWPKEEEDKQEEDTEEKGESAAAEVQRDVLFLNQPLFYEWNYRVVPPPGYAHRQLPPDGEEVIGPVKLSRSFNVQDDGSVTAHLRAESLQRRFSAEQAKALRQGIKKLQEAPPLLLQFEHKGEAHLEAGRIGEALKEFRQLAELHPGEALHHTQIARALLAGGLGEAAREEARRAVALEPDSAVSHYTLGWVLEHDLVGRRFKKGFDYEGAVTAYQKAIELDDKNNVYRASLAILLDYNSEGHRYGKGARLKEAIEAYTKILDDLPPGNPFNINLLNSMLRAGQFEELKTRVRGRPQQNAHVPFLLAAIAATDGADAALQEAARRFSVAETRREALLAAGRELMKNRRYPEAADLLTAGAQGTANATAILGQAELMHRTRRYEEIPLSETDPRGLALKFFVTSVLGSGQEAIGLLSKARRQKLDKDFADHFDRVQRVALEDVYKNELTAELAADLFLSAAQISVEGNDATGYRVHLQGPGVSGSIENVMLVVREDGVCRLLAVGDELELVGPEILTRLQAGNLDGARQLLDWVREERIITNGEDPLSGSPFPRFWTKGEQGTTERMRYAAAALMAVTKQLAETAVPILEEGRAQASEDEQARFDLALARAYLPTRQWEKELDRARALLSRYPRSDSAYSLVVVGLSLLKDWEGVKQVAGERLQLLPNDPVALRTLATVAWHVDDFPRAREIFQGLINAGKADPTDYNNLAWQALFDGTLSEESVQIATRGVRLTNEADASILHTLACVYADLGRAAEAREVIYKTMDIWGLDEPNLQVWYVFGRLAEDYGEDEAAIAAYKLVKPSEEELEDQPDPDLTLSTILLARDRLARLTGETQSAR